jgi:hypothetical protein
MPRPSRRLPTRPPAPAAGVGSRYAAAYSGPRRPGADEQDELLFPDDGEGSSSEGGASFMEGFAKFVKGFRAL